MAHDVQMKNSSPLEQLLTPRYPALSNRKLAGLFIKEAIKVLGKDHATAPHVKSLESVCTALDADETQPPPPRAAWH